MKVAVGFNFDNVYGASDCFASYNGHAKRSRPYTRSSADSALWVIHLSITFISHLLPITTSKKDE
jgi:hypothetical protein